MANKQKARISTFGSQFTSVVSVTLVLLILGILAMTLRASGSMGDSIRRNIGFIVKIDRDASDTEISRLKRELAAARFTESLAYTPADEILRQESELMGEPLDSLLDDNPFNPEIDVKVKPAFANSDSIAAIAARMELVPSIDEVVTETTVVDNINSVLSRLTIILMAIAAALLVISFVLINNTVSLAVYSRRFIIHTMKLVGATGAFIRRPFLLAGLFTGAIAALAACGILTGVKFYMSHLDPIFDQLITWSDMWLIFAVVVILGLLICLCASALATNRYLRLGYDDMFMK